MAINDPPTSPPSKTLSARARTHVPSSYTNLPKRWLDTYTSFVRANASQVSQLESALRSLVYIIPGRFHETPLSSESLQTVLTLLTAYHTHLLSPCHHSSPQSRYENFFSAASPLYARCAALLRTVQYTQLLCEMFAKRAGEKVRWRVVVILEIVKAICRVVMGRASGGRAVVGSQVGAESQERKMEDVNETERRTEGELDGTGLVDGEWMMPRTGLKLPRLPSPELGESITDFLNKRVVSADQIKSANRLVHRIQTVQGQIAELMWILRPVVYAMALQRMQGNKRDWRPWIAGLAMEVASRQLAKKDVRDTVIGGVRGLSVVEREEARRRGWGMAWWAMRGAFYENVTKGWIQAFASKLKGKPLLDMVGVVVDDYDYLWDQYYFPSATM